MSLDALPARSANYEHCKTAVPLWHPHEQNGWDFFSHYSVSRKENKETISLTNSMYG